MTTQIQVTVRLHPDLHDRLGQAAERDHRSKAAQITYYIERGLAMDESMPAGFASLEATEAIYRQVAERIRRGQQAHDAGPGGG